MSSASWKAWLLAIRPKTLTAALVPIGVGTSLAYATDQSMRPILSGMAFLSSIFIQIGTNLINDAIDFKKGADTAERVGPQRLTQSGLFQARSVWWAGILCFLLSALLAIPLVQAGGWPIICVGVLSLIAGYAYTGGPFPLAYLGLGDLFVLVFFGWVAVGGVFFLNTGTLNFDAAVAGTQVGLLATVLIAINNLRDAQTDQKVQKRTLAVRFGARFAKMEIAALCLLPFFCGAFWWSQGRMAAAFLPALLLPGSIRLVQKIQATEPSAVYNRFLAQSAALHLGFGILLVLGLSLRF